MQHLYGRTYLTSPRGQLGDYTYVGPLIQLPPRAYKKSTLRVTYMLPACKQHFGVETAWLEGEDRWGIVLEKAAPKKSDKPGDVLGSWTDKDTDKRMIFSELPPRAYKPGDVFGSWTDKDTDKRMIFSEVAWRVSKVGRRGYDRDASVRFLSFGEPYTLMCPDGCVISSKEVRGRHDLLRIWSEERGIMRYALAAKDVMVTDVDELRVYFPKEMVFVHDWKGVTLQYDGESYFSDWDEVFVFDVNPVTRETKRISGLCWSEVFEI